MSKPDRGALLIALAGFPARLAAASTVRTPIPPGEWGAAEVVRHLIAVEREVWQARLAQLAVEDDVQWTWIEPGLEPGLEGAPLDAIVARFAGVRAETVATIRALDDDEWARFGRHAIYGVLDIVGLLRIAVDHDADHLRGIDPTG